MSGCLATRCLHFREGEEIGEYANWRMRCASGFDLCLYNAGMDPYEGCPDGGLAGITEAVLAARERMVFDWCQAQNLPVAFSLAGGYIGEKLDERGLVALHRLTLSAAAATGKIKTSS